MNRPDVTTGGAMPLAECSYTIEGQTCLFETQEMSEYQIIAVIAAFVFLYCLIASRLESTRFSGALVYVACGLALGPFGLQLVDLDVDGKEIKRIAEITLAVVLFIDSAGAKLPVLIHVKRLPGRLLLVGLPLTILLGYIFGLLVYSDLPWVSLALLATMLAPTDAALGTAVVSNEAVPSSVRQGLNAESGFNDGICVPVLLLFLSLAGGAVEGSVTEQMVHLLLEEVGIGALVGIPFAVIGSSTVKLSIRNGWISGSWIHIPMVALALLCFATAQRLGGSGFIAAFVGGMTFGALIKEEEKESLLEGAESASDVLSMITWFVFGAVFIGDSLRNPDWQAVTYAVLSLTVIRMAPVFLCVSGLGMQWDTKLFVGWFGPRGLASIVFIVMVKEANVAGADILLEAVTWTILLSVIAHGITANPLAKIYASRVASRDGAI